MKITVKIKSVYGLETVYPACPAAEIFARIAGTKTLTSHALRDIRALGYEIAVKTDAPKVLSALAIAEV
jgi:hypothetical protein